MATTTWRERAVDGVLELASRLPLVGPAADRALENRVMGRQAGDEYELHVERKAAGWYDDVPVHPDRVNVVDEEPKETGAWVQEQRDAITYRSKHNDFTEMQADTAGEWDREWMTPKQWKETYGMHDIPDPVATQEDPRHTDHALHIRSGRDMSMSEPPSTPAAQIADKLSTAADWREAAALTAPDNQIEKDIARGYITEARETRIKDLWQSRLMDSGKPTQEPEPKQLYIPRL